MFTSAADAAGLFPNWCGHPVFPACPVSVRSVPGFSFAVPLPSFFRFLPGKRAASLEIVPEPAVCHPDRRMLRDRTVLDSEKNQPDLSYRGCGRYSDTNPGETESPSDSERRPDSGVCVKTDSRLRLRQRKAVVLIPCPGKNLGGEIPMQTNEFLQKLEELARLIQEKTDEQGQFQGNCQRVAIALDFTKKEILLPKENFQED